jgi:hypothetical protein
VHEKWQTIRCNVRNKTQISTTSIWLQHTLFQAYDHRNSHYEPRLFPQRCLVRCWGRRFFECTLQRLFHTNPLPPTSVQPQYMTVGTGSTSASARVLMESLDHDSGYGESIADDSSLWRGEGRGWHPGLIADRPTPSHTPVL